MKMTLARALKEKNRLASKMKPFIENRSKNVYFVKDTPNLNLKNIYNENIKLAERLAKLKALIAKANAENGICDKMYEMEELKGISSWLNYIDTNCTPVRKTNPVTGVEDVTERAAFLSFEFVESEKKRIQERIDKLQDEIDELNASVIIEF